MGRGGYQGGGGHGGGQMGGGGGGGGRQLYISNVCSTPWNWHHPIQLLTSVSFPSMLAGKT